MTVLPEIASPGPRGGGEQFLELAFAPAGACGEGINVLPPLPVVFCAPGGADEAEDDKLATMLKIAGAVSITLCSSSEQEAR